MHYQPVLDLDLRPGCRKTDVESSVGARLHGGIPTQVSEPQGRTRMRLDAYSASISDSYNFIVAFFITVPFPARNMGFSLLATKIISLKIRLNAGASLLASSMSRLATWWRLARAPSRTNGKPGNPPNHVPKFSHPFVVRHVDRMLWPRFHEHARLAPPAPKHAHAR
jgi:hypothetical protein